LSARTKASGSRSGQRLEGVSWLSANREDALPAVGGTAMLAISLIG
jgi:hypothetical protein